MPTLSDALHQHKKRWTIEKPKDLIYCPSVIKPNEVKVFCNQKIT
jgi:hypothetical protein